MYSEDVLHHFWTSCVRSIYGNCSGGKIFLPFSQKDINEKIWRRSPSSYNKPETSITCYSFYLTHFITLAYFYTHWKHQKTSGFMMFSGSIGKSQWHEMGYFTVFEREGSINFKWDKILKNGPSKICGRQSLKNFTWSILEYFVPNISLDWVYMLKPMCSQFRIVNLPITF